MKTFLIGLFIALLCLVSAGTARICFVSTTGNDGWNGLSPDRTGSDGPWKTIAKANTAVMAGDTVCIREGTYTNDFIKPGRSGSSESARIRYQNYNDETVTITAADYGIQCQNSSYITVKGIHFYNLDRFVIINGGSHNNVEYCAFDSMRSYVTWSGSHIQGSSRYNRIQHCTFSRWGIFDAGLARGAMFDLGSEGDTTDKSDYNRIEDCEFHSGGHHLLGIFSEGNVIRNNYFENDNWFNGAGYRCVITDGKDSTLNLFEGNRVCWAGGKPGESGASGFDLRYAHFIMRFNCFYKNAGSGITVATVNEPPFVEPHHNYIYNNVFYGNGTNPTDNSNAGISLRAWNGVPSDIRRNVIKNNILFKNPHAYTAWERTSLDSQAMVNNWEEAGDPQFVDTMAAGAKTVTKPDFRLKATSPCIDRGAFLTAIISPSGSGTSFQVEDARYFIDGWGIVDGDRVQLEGTADAVGVTNVNYTNNMLTVDKSITWQVGQKISLSYYGNSPDLGAYEYGTVQNIIYRGKQSFQAKSTLTMSGDAIRYTLSTGRVIALHVYSNTGKRVMTLLPAKPHAPGCYEIKRAALQRLGSGIYMVVMTPAMETAALKVVLVR
jgi:hypothetical protein